MHTRALVLFSGGQDSTTCLAHALTHYAHVETLGFDYGQRHSVELQARQTVLQRLRWQFPHWAARLGPDHVLNVDVIGQIGGSSLTEDVAIAMQQDGLPNTFVPGRNLLFMTLAGALAYRRGLQVLCIVNNRRHARALYESMADQDGARHLTTLMCARHRSQVLAEVRQRLRDGLPCRLVATSLIEAGVDVDFPCVLRAEAGLDSIAQAAGRCNREGRRALEAFLILITA